MDRSKILITGAYGQLGMELSEQLKKQKEKYNVFATGASDIDITALEDSKKIIFKIKPDIVINCAAYTDVEKCENNSYDAYLINAIGARNLAIICNEIGAKLVQISTDYVFDGLELSIIKEDEKTKPVNIYGKSKLLGEKYVENFCKKYFIIRTAWLYGDGRNFVNTILEKAKNNSVINVVGDQFGTPTSTKELSDTIIRLIDTEYYGLYHATCEGYCSWYDLAVKIFEIKNIDVCVNKICSEELFSNVKRPKYSVLDNFMLKLHKMNNFSKWEDALIDFLKDR